MDQEVSASAFVVSVLVAREWTRPAAIEASPARGTYRAVPEVPEGQGWRGDLGFSVVPRAWLGGVLQGDIGLQVRWLNEDGDHSAPVRGTVRLEYARRVGELHRWVAGTYAGFSGGTLSQDSIRAGGPVTGPGYSAHQFVSGLLFAQRIEWQFPAPFPSIPMGRWGRSPSRAMVAPLFAIVVQEERDATGSRSVAGYPAIGAGLLVFFDLVRFDVARGLRNGRWTFGVDLTRDLWRIL